MIASMRHRRRSLPIVLAGLGVVATVAGCADSGEGEAATPASSAPASAGSSAAAEQDGGSPEDELAAALLPEEAFGPEADVVTVDVRQVSTSVTGGLSPDATTTPPECGQSLGATQLTPEDFGASVAQSATGPADVTVEVLAESEQLDGEAASFDELVAQCPQVTVSAPDGTTATIDFTDLAVPDLGDASDGVAFTTAVRAADGTGLTVPTFLAVALDGRRMVYLQRTGTSSAPLDEAAFSELFEQAFAAQQDR